ncbi:MAG: hypothetical protein GX050_04020 [Firmicutes bacterium]|nr:hypothetical protein [Bacillota bacterium]
MRIKFWLLWLLPLFLSGCWDAEEVTKRTVVMALGLDRMENGRIKVTLQLPIVEELFPLSAGTPVVEKPFSILSAEGETGFAAVPGLQAKAQRSLFFGQIKALLISRKLAETGLKGVIDPLHRHAKIPPQAFVYLTEDRANDMLDHSFWHKRIASEVLVDYFHAIQSAGTEPRISLSLMSKPKGISRK